MMSPEISVGEVKQKIDAGEKLHLVDVREPGEFEIARIPGGELFPMRRVSESLPQLQLRAAEAPLIVYCHHGVRSLNVVHWLRGQGIENCLSLSGGIDAWSRQIDASIPVY